MYWEKLDAPNHLKFWLPCLCSVFVPRSTIFSANTKGTLYSYAFLFNHACNIWMNESFFEIVVSYTTHICIAEISTRSRKTIFRLQIDLKIISTNKKDQKNDCIYFAFSSFIFSRKFSFPRETKQIQIHTSWVCKESPCAKRWKSLPVLAPLACADAKT